MKLALLLCSLLFTYEDTSFSWPDDSIFEPWDEDYSIQYVFQPEENMCMSIPLDTFIGEEIEPVEEMRTYPQILCTCIRCLCNGDGECWLGCGNAAQVSLIFYRGLFVLPELDYSMGSPFESDYGKIWNNNAEYLTEIRP